MGRMSQKDSELGTMKHASMLKALNSGFLSGSVSTLLLQPLEVAKTQLQTNKHLDLSSVWRHIFRSFGVQGFWRGTVVSLYRNTGGMALYYPTLYFLQFSIYGSEKPSPLGSFSVGATVRLMTCCIFCPLNVVKTRFESGSINYSGILNALTTIYRVEGLSKLYSGLTATIARDLPHSGFNVMFYWEIKARLPGKSVLLESSFAGFLAAALSCALTHPQDVIKTKMQNSPADHPTFRRACGKIVWNHGMTGFYLGFVPRTSRKVALSIINWVVLEFVAFYL